MEVGVYHYLVDVGDVRGFLRDDYEVEFEGNSLASQLCSNYQPSLCAHGRNLQFLDWLLEP